MHGFASPLNPENRLTDRPPRRLITASVGMATALVLALSACSPGEGDGQNSGAENGGGEQSDSAPRTVDTPMGEVEVPGNPERVVVLNYALAGYLYDLGIPVVGMVPEDADADGEFSELWGDAPEEDGTEFLPWSPEGFDLEAVLEMDPDLIIAGGWGFPYFQAEEAYEELSDIAPTVMVDQELADWQEQYSFLAEDVFDEPETYQDSVENYEARLEEVAEAIELPPQPTSFVSVLADGTPYLVLEDTGLPRVFEDLGFEIAPLGEEHELDPYVPGGDMAELSTEQLGQIMDAETLFVFGFNTDTYSAEDLREESVWRSLPAMDNDEAYDLPYWVLRHDYDEAIEMLDIVEETFSS